MVTVLALIDAELGRAVVMLCNQGGRLSFVTRSITNLLLLAYPALFWLIWSI